MSTRATRRRTALVAAVLVALGLAAASAAYFSSAGAGSGSAAVGGTGSVTIVPGTAVAQLYPGASGDVVATVSNANSIPVHFSALALDPSQGSGGFAVDASHSDCPTSALSYTTQSNGGSGWTVPARVGSTNGTLALTLTNAVAMGRDAAAACQGAVFSVYLKAGA